MKDFWEKLNYIQTRIDLARDTGHYADVKYWSDRMRDLKAAQVQSNEQRRLRRQHQPHDSSGYHNETSGSRAPITAGD